MLFKAGLGSSKERLHEFRLEAAVGLNEFLQICHTSVVPTEWYWVRSNRNVCSMRFGFPVGFFQTLWTPAKS